MTSKSVVQQKCQILIKNKTFRMITKALFYISNKTQHTDLKTQTVLETAKYLSKKPIHSNAWKSSQNTEKEMV